MILYCQADYLKINIFISMSKARKEGKPKRNRRNVVKKLRIMQHTADIIRQLKKDYEKSN